MSAVQAVIKAYGRPGRPEAGFRRTGQRTQGAAPGSVPLHAGSEVCAVRVRCARQRTGTPTLQIHHVINDITGLTSLAIVDAILQFAEKLEAIILLQLNPPGHLLCVD